MANGRSFIKILDKAELAKRNLETQIEYVRRFYQESDRKAAYDAALRLEETAEKLTLLTRRLPAYTGNPMAAEDAGALHDRNYPS